MDGRPADPLGSRSPPGPAAPNTPENRLESKHQRARVQPLRMKKSALTPVLLVVLLVFALGTLGLTYMNVQMIRKARSLQDVANRINNVRVTLDALARDAIAYSQTNRAIDPILISVGLKPGPANSPGTATGR
jgi:uncharacterized protein HemX